MISFLELVYWFIPGYLANASPPLLAKWFPSLLLPIDNGKKWRGRRILGNHKTWLGLIGGTLLGGVFFLLQKYFLVGLFSHSNFVSPIPYASLPWWYGFLFAFGAIGIGDLGKSFLKRRFAIRPGKPWIPFDQFDYTIGAFLAVSWLWTPGWLAFLFLLLLNGLLSAFTHFLAGTFRVTKERI